MRRLQSDASSRCPTSCNPSSPVPAAAAGNTAFQERPSPSGTGTGSDLAAGSWSLHRAWLLPWAAASLLWTACNGCSGQGTAAPARPEPAAVEAPAPKFETTTEVHFAHVAKEAGVQFVYDNGRAAGHHVILESLGGGGGLVDYDLDGRLDIFMPGGGYYGPNREVLGLPSVLYRNVGNWKFADVSAAAGVKQPLSYTHGVTAGDYNSDGFPDLLVTGYDNIQLFMNQGDGTFQEVHEEAGLQHRAWSTSPSWADYNGDGHLDVFIPNYVNWSWNNNPTCGKNEEGIPEICSPRRFSGLIDNLYYSNGDGTFRDVSAEAGIRQQADMDSDKGLGSVAGDIDLDGDVDLYVANDTTDNFLYINDGRGVFEEVGLLNGVARDAVGHADGSMGVDFGDFNLDGLPDIWVANFEEESFALYKNDGGALFSHVSQATGVTALGNLFVGFGTMFVDLDLDGDLDIVVSNGHVINFPTQAPIRQEPLMLINDRGQRLLRARLPKESYFSQPHRGRGLAVGDIDNDGDMDLLFTHNDEEPAAVLRNDTPRHNKWLAVRLIGRHSNRDCIGARLVLHTSVGDQLRLIKGGTSYLCQNDMRVYWGVPKNAQVTGLTIYWPRGAVQQLEEIRLEAVTTLLEPLP